MRRHLLEIHPPKLKSIVAIVISSGVAQIFDATIALWVGDEAKKESKSVTTLV